jgi:Family of unknown function (DUF6600)
MNRTPLRLGLLILFLSAAGAVKIRAADVDIGFFYNELAPYGEWISVTPYGWVWAPYDIGPGWRPYTDGNWVYSDFGWTFVSPVDWGWAAYHYGRWTFNPEYGWVWVPGNVWGPAWVAWRNGGGYLGWAPLPPEVGWSAGFGLDFGGFDIDARIGPYAWAFCGLADIDRPALGPYLVNPARNVTLIRMTKNVTHYTIINNKIVNNNVPISEIEKVSGRRISRYTLADQTVSEKGHRAQASGNELRMFRPAISAQKTTAVPKNVLPPRFKAPSAEILQRQTKEKDQLNSFYDGKLSELKKGHQQEAANPPKGTTPEELSQRHQEEIKALQEQKNKDAQALENKHKREQGKNPDHTQSRAPAEQSKKKPKDK